jgi:hypothetical protein
MAIKDTIPTIEALEAKISSEWSTIEQKINQELSGSWRDFTKARRNLVLVIGIVSILFLAVYFSGVPLDFWSWFFVCVAAFWIVYTYIHRFYKTYSWYTFQLDKFIHVYLFDLFGLFATHRKIPAEEIRSELAYAALVTDRVDSYRADDFVSTTYLGSSLTLTELHLTRTEQQGKNTVTVEVFKGIFASY